MNLLKKLFAFTSKKDSRTVPDTKPATLEEQFAAMDTNERLRAIMAFGNTGKLEFYDLLKQAILSETNKNVQFAALKRIHLFKTHPDLIPFLKSFQLSENSGLLEPYLSMALGRTGIITQEEFKGRVNVS